MNSCLFVIALQLIEFLTSLFKIKPSQHVYIIIDSLQPVFTCHFLFVISMPVNAPRASNPFWMLKPWPPSDPTRVPPSLKRRVSLNFDPCVWECGGNLGVSCMHFVVNIKFLSCTLRAFWPHGSSENRHVKVLKTEWICVCPKSRKMAFTGNSTAAVDI